MYDERLEKLLFQAPSANLEGHAANDHDADAGPPYLPPPREPFGRSWNDGREPEDPVSRWDVLFVVILFVALCTVLAGLLAWKLM